MMALSRGLRIVVGIVISIGLLAVAFYEVHVEEFWASLMNIDATAIILCISFFAVSCLVRAAMWHITTRQIERVKFSALFGGVIVGYMANYLLPLRGGELVRTYYLTARTDITSPCALATVFMERILDVFSLMLLLSIGVILGIRGLAHNTAAIYLAALGGAVLSAVAVVAVLLKVKRPPRFQGVLATRVLPFLGNFCSSIAQMKERNTLIPLLLLNIAAWVSNYVSVFYLLPSLPGASFQAALLLLLFINLGFLVPSSPGSLGVIQIAFWMALSPFGIVKENSLALSFAYQGSLLLFTLVLGIPYFLGTGFRFRSLFRTPGDTGRRSVRH